MVVEKIDGIKYVFLSTGGSPKRFHVKNDAYTLFRVPVEMVPPPPVVFKLYCFHSVFKPFFKLLILL